MRASPCSSSRCGQRLDELDRAFARRVDQRLVERQNAAEAFARRGEQIGDDETRAIAQAVARRVLLGATDQRSQPSTPTTCAPRRAIGSVKLPRPQKKSAIRSPGCGSSSDERAPHEHAIDCGVDLREFGRPERHRRRRIPAARSRAASPADGTARPSPARRSAARSPRHARPRTPRSVASSSPVSGSRIRNTSA